MKPMNSKSRSSYSIAEGIGSLEFMKRISNEITNAMNDQACSCPIEARDQWSEMSQSERLSFVSASLECFFWIYISRKERDSSISYPSWESASINQQVITAAGFCLFILGTEFEQYDHEGDPNMDALATEWIN
jgi:hypothetical protein